MKMCSDHESFSTFKVHIFFLWKFTNEGDQKKIQNSHMTLVPNKVFPAAFPLDASGLARSVDTVDFLNDCCRTNFFCIGWTWRLREYSLNKHTVIFLFRTGKILSFLHGVILPFKQLKWRKVSLLYLWLNVYLVVSINTALMSLAS